jgi:hypothetical protein
MSAGIEDDPAQQGAALTSEFICEKNKKAIEEIAKNFAKNGSNKTMPEIIERGTKF